MLLKFLAPIMLFVIAIIQGLYSQKLNEKKKLKVIFIFLLIILLITSIFVIQIDDNNSKKDFEVQKQNINSLRIKNLSLTSKIDSLHSELKIGMKRRNLQNIELKEKVQELNTKLEPFIKVALTKYPAQNLQYSLNQLAKDIENTKKLAEPPVLVPIAKEISSENM